MVALAHPRHTPAALFHRPSKPNPLYDRANNKKIEYKSHDSTNSLHEQYRYDSVYRLASTGAGGQSQNSRGFERGSFSSGARTGIATTSSYQDWDLDGVGNWPRFDNDGSVDNRTHSDFNEIVSANSFTHVHDVNGNLTDDDTRELEWDALNRLKRVTRKSDSEVVAEYVYDCHNRRMAKVVTNGGIPDDAGLNGTTRFYYDGWRVVEERDGSDGILRQFTYGNYLDEVWTLDDRDGVSVADLNDGTGDERLFCHSNTLYHVYANTDEAGAIKEAVQAYDAYGNATVITGAGTDTTWFTSDDVTASATALGNPYFYTGQRLDSETGLMYYKNRYYSVDLGRFVSRDPIGSVLKANLFASKIIFRYGDLRQIAAVKSGVDKIGHVRIRRFVELPFARSVHSVHSLTIWRSAISSGVFEKNLRKSMVAEWPRDLSDPMPWKLVDVLHNKYEYCEGMPTQSVDPEGLLPMQKLCGHAAMAVNRCESGKPPLCYEICLYVGNCQHMNTHHPTLCIFNDICVCSIHN